MYYAKDGWDNLKITHNQIKEFIEEAKIDLSGKTKINACYILYERKNKGI